MKRNYFKLLIVAPLLLSAFAHSAAPTCLDSGTDDVDQFLSKQIADLELKPTAIPELLLLREDVELEFTSKGLRKNIFVEGFLKFDSGSYRLVPGLGLTVKAKENSLFYVCVQIKGQSSENFLRIIHLERNGILVRRFRTEPVPLTIRPINEGVLLLEGFLRVLHIADPQKADKRKGPSIEGLVNEIFGTIFRLGAEQLDIRPKRFEITMVSQVLSSLKLTRSRHSFPVKSEWLVSDQ